MDVAQYARLGSLVTVTFQKEGEDTLVPLSHENPPDDAHVRVGCVNERTRGVGFGAMLQATRTLKIKEGGLICDVS